MRPRKLSQFFSFISQGVCMIVLSITSSSFFFSPVPLPPPPLNPPFSFPFCFGPLSVTASLSIKRERALGPNTALQRTEAERKGGTELGTDWREYNRVLAFFLCCLRRLLACFACLLPQSSTSAWVEEELGETEHEEGRKRRWQMSASEPSFFCPYYYSFRLPLCLTFSPPFPFQTRKSDLEGGRKRKTNQCQRRDKPSRPPLSSSILHGDLLPCAFRPSLFRLSRVWWWCRWRSCVCVEPD